MEYMYNVRTIYIIHNDPHVIAILDHYVYHTRNSHRNLMIYADK